METDPGIISPPISKKPLRFPNPLKTLVLLFEPEASLILFASAFLFAGFYGLMAGLPSQFEKNYGFDSLHVGLCFLPSGAGGCIAAIVTGRLMDKNFQRHARKLGIDPSDTRRIRTLASYPIEAARLEVALPFILTASAAILAFGWVMHFNTHLSGPLILLFFIGWCLISAFTTLITLTVDLFPEKPATAIAASNLTRCWLGGGATALVIPMINRIGIGWTFTFVAALSIALCPALLAVMRWGPGMRAKKEERRKAKMERQERERGSV